MRLVSVALSAALLLGCTPVVSQRGYLPDPIGEAAIKIGSDTKTTVQERLGDPSTQATFGGDVWYYISSVERQVAFFDPSVQSRSIMAVHFDKNGKVANVRHYALKDGNVVVHGMTTQDIKDVINAFAQAAKDAQRIGMDGVEIHGAHGYLVDQFFWEGSNQRTDEYGGSLANRSRFAIELIQATRAAVGPDFPIIFRFSQWKQQDYSARLVQTPEALGEFLKPLSDAGVDIFHCSTRRFWEPEFEGSDLNLAGWTRQLTGKPTITVGSVGLDGEFLQFMVNTDKVAQPASLEKLLERLNNDEFDLVAVGRALLVDPDWAVKVREGREGDILPFSREALMSLV